MSDEFRAELESLINRHSKENGSNTPDFVLADYLADCLEAFDKAVTRRSEWYGDLKADMDSEVEPAEVNQVPDADAPDEVEPAEVNQVPDADAPDEVARGETLEEVADRYPLSDEETHMIWAAVNTEWSRLAAGSREDCVRSAMFGDVASIIRQVKAIKDIGSPDTTHVVVRNGGQSSDAYGWVVERVLHRLGYMDAEWFDLNPKGWHVVVASGVIHEV